MSLVARQEGVSAGRLFRWLKLERQDAARARIAKLQRVLGKKTLGNEVLREAVEYPVGLARFTSTLVAHSLLTLRRPR